MTKPNLTRYPPGSLSEISIIALPLILSSLSSSIMFFCDRLIFAKVSLNIMNAAAAANTQVFWFHHALAGVVSVSQVLVGRYYGNGNYRMLGTPVWQMLWFAAASYVIFLPVALFADVILLPRLEYRLIASFYFRASMLAGPIIGMVTALCGYFIAQGRVRFITLVVSMGSVLNIVLDWLLILGFGDFAGLGIDGAALATWISQLGQLAIFMAAFIRKQRQMYPGSERWQFHSKVMHECLRIGVPHAVSHIFEFAMWPVLMQIMQRFGELHVTVLAMGQALFVLFVFITEGIHKAVLSTSAHAMASSDWHRVALSLKNAIKLTLVFSSAVAIPFLGFPQEIVSLFAKKASVEHFNELMAMARPMCTWIWGYFFIDTITWTIGGLLTAAGDTLYLMLANFICVSIGAILPAYWLFTLQTNHPLVIWQIIVVYSLLLLICFCYRYWRAGWRHRAATLISA